MNFYKYSLGTLAILFFLTAACTSPIESVEELTTTDLLQGTWVVQKAMINDDEYPVTNPGFGQIEAIFDGDQYKYIFPEIGNNGLPTGKTNFIEGIWSLNQTEDIIIIDRSSIDQDALRWEIINLSKGILETEYAEYFPGSEVPSVFRISYRLK